METPASSQNYTREDILRYQLEMNQYIAQFRQDRQEVDALLQEVRDQQFKYEGVILDQNEKIKALQSLVLFLTNKVNDVTK